MSLTYTRLSCELLCMYLSRRTWARVSGAERGCIIGSRGWNTKNPAHLWRRMLLASCTPVRQYHLIRPFSKLHGVAVTASICTPDGISMVSSIDQPSPPADVLRDTTILVLYVRRRGRSCLCRSAVETLRPRGVMSASNSTSTRRKRALSPSLAAHRMCRGRKREGLGYNSAQRVLSFARTHAQGWFSPSAMTSSMTTVIT